MAAGALKRGVAECCFKAADKSGDGKISLKEAKGLYRAIMDGDMPTYMVDDAGKELLQDADANADGAISYIEWLEYFSYSADTVNISIKKIRKRLPILQVYFSNREIFLKVLVGLYDERVNLN